jgi:2-polyprenyl-3-methyl-5-hydroxy-6-metoxy-1,4-benzoquinol methylase
MALDLASGVGDMPSLVAKEGWDVKSTEIHKPFIKFAKETLDVFHHELTIHDYLKNHKQNGADAFDVVGTFGYFDMIPDQTADAIVINKLLKLGGHIGVNIPICVSLTGQLALLLTETSLRTLLPTDYSVFSKESIFLMLENEFLLLRVYGGMALILMK